MIRLLCVLVALSLGCAFAAVKREGEWMIIGELARSGEYTVEPEKLEMKTHPMSPVLGGVVAGAIAAGAGGAAVGGGAGLLKEGVDLMVGGEGDDDQLGRVSEDP
jgi:hypothetical protein